MEGIRNGEKLQSVGKSLPDAWSLLGRELHVITAIKANWASPFFHSFSLVPREASRPKLICTSVNGLGSGLEEESPRCRPAGTNPGAPAGSPRGQLPS